MYQLVDDKILIAVDDTFTAKTSGGIMTFNLTNPDRGKVIACGPGVLAGDVRIPPMVSKGETVIFSPAAAKYITLSDGKFAVVRESEIFGVLLGDVE